MGTMVRIVLYAADAAAARGAADAAFARVAALDETLSDYRDTSEVTRVSRASGGGPTPVSDDLFRVLRASQSMARATGGAFDATAGPLTLLWRAARRRSELPDAGRLDAALGCVGYDRMELDEVDRTVRLKATGMQLDLGGIAKGFAADEAVIVLGGRGIGRALVAAGGDIVGSDAPPGQDGWHVAIAGDGARAGGSVLIRNGAVSTSGDAEQFLEVAGVRYSHIIDPRTGRAVTGRSSVTVVARTGMTADSLATAVSVMGPGTGLAVVDGIAGAAARMTRIEEDGRPRTYVSARWRER